MLYRAPAPGVLFGYATGSMLATLLTILVLAVVHVYAGTTAALGRKWGPSAIRELSEHRMHLLGSLRNSLADHQRSDSVVRELHLD